MQPDQTSSCSRTNWLFVALAAGLGAACLWVYWPALRDMAAKWTSDPQYSHGYLVPVFSVALLVIRRGQLAGACWQLDWRGLVLLAVGAAGFVAGGAINFDWLTAASLLPAVAGLVLLFGGAKALRWAWPAVAFLVFMIPLPHSVELALGHPLQRFATASSTRVIQALGFPAFSEGNVISLEHGKIAVVEACSGLSMLLTFAAITTGMAMIVQRPLVDKLVIVASTVPVALAVNVARIVLNGVAIEVWDAETANRVFHDLGGWLMMPLAVAAVWFELWILSRLFVEVPEKAAVPLFGLPGQPPARPDGPRPAHP